MKKALFVLGFLLAAVGPSLAQTSGEAVTGFRLAQGSTYGSFTCPSTAFQPCFVQYGSSIPITGSISASLAGFTPTAAATANVSDVVNTSQDVALPAGTDLVVTNKGTVDVNFRIQVGAGAAVSTDQTLKAGAATGIHVGSATHLSVIAPTGTGTGATAGQLNIQGGSGLASGYGGGGGSTFSGVVTNAGTFAVQLTGATNNLNNISGTISLPTGASTAALQTAGNASLATIATNSGSPIPAGTFLIGKVGFDQTTPGTTNGIAILGNTVSGATAYGLQTGASTNSTLVSTGAHTVYGMNLESTSTTAMFLRMYDTAGAPTCSSATGFVRSWAIPPAASAGLVGGITVKLPPQGVKISTGLGFCVTGGVSSTDNTNATTGGLVNLDYQ